MDRARQAIAQQKHEPRGHRDLLRLTDRVFVKDGESCWFVPLSDVRLFEVDGSHSRIYFGSHRPLIPKTLNYLESRLDPQFFFRASRRHIVNLHRVKDVEPWFSGGLRLTLKDGQTIEVPRRQAQHFRELMSL